MALNIPMPDSPGNSLLKGLDTGSSMFSRMIQPVIERERMKQAQNQFVQDYALRKQNQDKQNTLLPYMIQQYQDAHRTAAGEAKFKELYRNLIQGALNGGNAGSDASSGSDMPPQVGNGQPPAPSGMLPQGMGIPLPGGASPQAPGVPPQMGGMPPSDQSTPDKSGQAPTPSPIGSPMPVDQDISGQEHELRAGNPSLTKLDKVAGLVPGIPKPVQHINNGLVFTTYPSGRMTVQKVQGAQSPGEKTVSAREASKIRDSATSLVNSANLVQHGYDLLDQNPNLTGPGTGLGNKFNILNSEPIGKFNNVTGKLQAELGKYASSRGGIQAVNWAASVKPSLWKPQDTNYGMFEGIQNSLNDDYNTLNQQYKAATGEDLPVKLPAMTSTRGKIQIRNKKTGETKYISQQEAKQMGLS